MGFNNLGFSFFQKNTKNLKSPNFSFFVRFFSKPLKIQIFDSQSQQKIVAFQLCYCYSLHMTINDVVRERGVFMYEIFFVNFRVIILCPIFVR